ncbi:MAG: CBS domain-containing protein [Planctomycetota bacterium]|jgi:CBS domain-containing protein
MKVQDVMNKEPHAVRIVDRLDEVARIMWEQDCGFVPVVDGANTLVGVVTDRDLCMASYMQGVPIASIPVVAVMVPEPVTCRPEDSVVIAMNALAERQVHRLPVVDSQGVLIGVLSMNDLMQAAQARPTAVAAAKVLATMAAITKPRSGARDFVESDNVRVKSVAVSKAATATGRVVAPQKRAAKVAAKPAPKSLAKGPAKVAPKAAAKTPAKTPARATPKKAAAKAPAKTAAKSAKASKSRAIKGKAKA